MAIQIESPETKIEHAQVSFVGPKASRVALGTWAIGGWMWDRRVSSDRHDPRGD